MSRAKKWGHDELASDLANYLRETRGVLAWEDMQLGPAGSARPDVYTIPKSYSKFRPMVYECKVSVSDFRADITKGKWHNYLKYACGVVFAVPSGLITKNDLPDGCGLIVRSDASWRMSKGPTMQALENMPRDAWLKLMMDGTRREGDRGRIEGRNIWHASQALIKRFGEDAGELIRETSGDLERLRKLQASVRDQAAELEQFRREARKKAQAEVQREIADLSDAQKDLAEELGLPRNASPKELQMAIWKARRRFTEDAEMNRLKRAFRMAKNALEDGLESLPGDKPLEPEMPASWPLLDT